MHRTALGALTAALALPIAALSVPAVVAEPLPAVTTVAAPARVARTVAPAGKPCRAGLVALTFDDGPSATITPRLVRILRRAQVPATFFMVGSRIRTAPAAARLVQSSGFVVANHTWSHPQLTRLRNAQIAHQLRSTRHEMVENGIRPTNLMRPPYGAISPRVRRDIRRLGLVPVLWTIDSRDWAGGSTRQIAGRILRALRPHRTNLVLQHDGVTNSPNSVRAVPIVIREARRRGYCFAEIGPNGKPVLPSPSVRAISNPGDESGRKPVLVRFDLDRSPLRPVSLRVHTVDGSARAGEDYVARDTRIAFPVGVRTRFLVVDVLDDTIYERSQDVAVVLDRPSGVRIPTATYAAAILSDDPLPKIRFNFLR